MIYFIQARPSGAIKIWVAGHPEKRLASLQTGSHELLTLVGVIPGDVPEEHRLHARFAAYHLRGEWFRGDPKLMAWIGGVIAPGLSPGHPPVRWMAERFSEKRTWLRSDLRHEAVRAGFAPEDIENGQARRLPILYRCITPITSPVDFYATAVGNWPQRLSLS